MQRLAGFPQAPKITRFEAHPPCNFCFFCNKFHLFFCYFCNKFHLSFTLLPPFFLHCFLMKKKETNTLCFSEGSRYLCTGGENVHIWDLKKREVIRKFKVSPFSLFLLSPFFSCAFFLIFVCNCLHLFLFQKCCKS